MKYYRFNFAIIIPEFTTKVRQHLLKIVSKIRLVWSGVIPDGLSRRRVNFYIKSVFLFRDSGKMKPCADSC